MTEVATPSPHDPVDSLNKAFMLDFPIDAARSIEALPLPEAVAILEDQPIHVASRVFEKLTYNLAEAIFLQLPEAYALRLINTLDIRTSVSILGRLNKESLDHYFSRMDGAVASELRSLLEYPLNTAGRLMRTKTIAFHENTSVAQALSQIRNQNIEALHHLYLFDDDMRLKSQVDIQRVALAKGERLLSSLSKPIIAYVNALDPSEEITEKLEKNRVEHLPVVDIDHRLIGVIEGQGVIDALKENIATDMQTMVGASPEERALSSSFFSVKKRHPWLQINLLTGFLAAAVVGMFESTIAQYTALAVLLPIAAGQSGNTGAQALAVTMRGLTLKEISMRHWWRVSLKECGAGFLNGIGISITCGAGIYIWSKSFGLALVMALAMVISMTIAGVSGALVPIVLKRFGMDPAQSSSIVLTTVTDIAGFMSFLGIATLLSHMLVAS